MYGGGVYGRSGRRRVQCPCAPPGGCVRAWQKNTWVDDAAGSRKASLRAWEVVYERFAGAELAR